MNKRRLLIIGCGNVAKRTVSYLLARFKVYALVRDSHKMLDLRRLGIIPIYGDLACFASLARIVGLAEVVLHTAPPTDANDLGTKRLIAILRKARILPHRLIYISTTGVYGDYGGAWISETAPVLLTSTRSKQRLQAECYLRDFGRHSRITVSIIRSSGIYAANVLPIAALQAGMPAMLAEQDSYTNHIHLDDLAKIVSLALFRGRMNRIYQACDDSPIKVGDWFDKVAESFALPKPRRLTRDGVKAQVSADVWSFIGQSRRLMNRRIKHELKCSLQYPSVQAGLLAIKGGK